MPTVDCAALAARIQSLETAHDDLIAGRKARVLVDQNGERIEFNGGDARRLWSHIQSLKYTYGKECTTCAKPASRPILPFF